MPELTAQSTPPPVVTPPTINPAEWERFEGFRETFLLYFTRKPDNEALRTVAARGGGGGHGERISGPARTTRTYTD